MITPRRHRAVGLSTLALLLSALCVGGTAWAAPSSGPQPSLNGAEDPEPSVLVFGVPGLRWQDVSADTTPYLWELAARSSLGQMSTRSARSLTCPADGWVQLGTGNRARYPVPEEPTVRACPPLPGVAPTSTGGGRVVGWDAVVEENEDLAFNAVAGLLGQSVSDAGSCVLAAGAGSALGAGDTSGVVSVWRQDPLTLSASDLQRCSLNVIGTEPLSLQRRPGELSAIDSLIERIDAIRPANALLMVLGVSDLPDERAQLHTALLNGSGFTGGVLRSGSTRRAPFVQLSDVAPTVLDRLGLPVPDEMPYQPMTVSQGAAPSDRLSWFDELAQQADVQGQLTPSFFGVLVLVQRSCTPAPT